MQNLFTLLLFAFCSLAAFAQKDARESYRPTVPIVVDGDPSEWKTDWLLDQDGKFLYNVGNDDSNLYFRVKISDDLTQEKIALFGLTLKLNLEGKKKGKFGLRYPVGKDAKQLKKDFEPLPQDAAGRAIAKRLLLDEVEVLELIGLAKENIVSSRLGLMNGIEVLIVANEDGTYVYEAKIPYKAFKIDKSKVPVLGVAFETGRPEPVKGGSPPPNPNQAGRTFNQGNFNQYNPGMSPTYMWVAVKLK